MPRKAKNIEAIAVMLPEDLVSAARNKLLSERGIELETYLSVYLRTILRAGKSILGLNDAMTFGKYSGEKVENIVRIDPNYMTWIVTQDSRTKFEPEVILLLNEIAGTRSNLIEHKA